MNTRENLEIRRAQAIALATYLLTGNRRGQDAPPKLHGAIVRVIDELAPDTWGDLAHLLTECYLSGQYNNWAENIERV